MSRRGGCAAGRARGRLVEIFTVIKLRTLERCYRSGQGLFYVLRRITLDVQEGEFVTVMGPSGAGKSTLLSILGMLDAEFDGEYHFLDRPVHQIHAKERCS